MVSGLHLIFFNIVTTFRSDQSLCSYKNAIEALYNGQVKENKFLIYHN